MNADGFAPKGGDTIQGRFATITDDSVRRMARRVQLPEAEIRDLIRTVRWREAREWIDNYVRPWIASIHDRKSAEAAMQNMPPEWITGDAHIDEVAGAYATALVETSARKHRERVERDREIAHVLPPRSHPRRHEIRAEQKALKAGRR